MQICKLMRHIAPTDALQITARYAEINIQVYGPQVVVAANTLCLHPSSKIAKENLEGERTVFIHSRESLGHGSHFLVLCSFHGDVERLGE